MNVQGNSPVPTALPTAQRVNEERGNGLVPTTVAAMDAVALATWLIEPEGEAAVVGWSVEETTGVVARLKVSADEHWLINPNRSLELADAIIRIGKVRHDGGHLALGTMSRGDALKFLGRTEEAWQAFETAGLLFRDAGDELGWARTRIGPLFICASLNRVAEALAGAEAARQVFQRLGADDFLVRLDVNTGYLHYCLGNHQQALELYRAALAIAERPGHPAQRFLGSIYTNVGIVYDVLAGDLQAAATYYERARTFSVERHDTKNTALANLNLAFLAMEQGRYRQALRLLYIARDVYESEQLGLDANHVNRHIVECYVLLNRFSEARDLACEVVGVYRDGSIGYELARTLLLVATAEAALGRLDAAQAALWEAEAVFGSRGATTWSTIAQLRAAEIGLRQGEVAAARDVATAAEVYFATREQPMQRASALLLRAQALIAEDDAPAASEAAAAALRIAHRCNAELTRYGAHLALGRAAETQGDLRTATRRYRAAIAVVDRVQRGLTLPLRPGFMEDKGEALRALIALQMRTGEVCAAFDTLERAKSQALLSYLTNRECLGWAHYLPGAEALVAEFDRLRAEYQSWYARAHGEPRRGEDRAARIPAEEMRQELAAREQRLRAISERLYLGDGEGQRVGRLAVPRYQEVCANLDDETLLVEFYDDGAAFSAFALDAKGLTLHALPASTATVTRLLAQLKINLTTALAIDARQPPAPALTQQAQRLLEQLNRALLAPLGERLAGWRRLLIVPYGALHYVPFHLLHDGSAYLLERFEVAIMPAAAYATRPAVTRGGGARVLAYAADDRLPRVRTEARMVRALCGGELHSGGKATRAALRRPPRQVLHIAAHGEHRLDAPDLSYIELSDGHLYTDDLLQEDLSYELVTLSACETGQARVAPGDELIGLGRGFLYAGAGALITSLWPVVDTAAHETMKHLYRALLAGASKAAALRTAQLAVRAANPRAHPAYWGAFQLVGDARPLSTSQP